MPAILQKMKKLGHDGFFSILFGGTLAKMISFLSSIVIVRIVDKSAYASLAYADNIYNYVFLFSGLGMASAILKFGVNKEQRINKAYYLFAFQWGSFAQIILLATVLILTIYIPLPFPNAKKLIVLLIPYGLLYYWYNLFQSYLRTQFENRKYALANLFQVAFTFIFSFLFVKLIGITGITMARILAILLSILPFIPTIIRYTRKTLPYKLCWHELRPFLIMSLSLMISNVFSMIMPANETFLINNLIKDEIISANYKVASLIPSQLPFVTSTIVIYYFPIFARQASGYSTWQSAKNVGFYTFLLTLGITIIGVLLSPFIIKTAYGNAYGEANQLSTILWGVYFINAGFRMIPMNILPALGYIKFNLILSILSSIVHFFLDFFLINSLGIRGAVFSTVLIYMCSGFLYWIYLYKKCKEF